MRRSAQAREHEPQQVRTRNLEGEKDREVHGYMPHATRSEGRAMGRTSIQKGNQKLVIRCRVKNGTASLGGGKNLG